MYGVLLWSTISSIARGKHCIAGFPGFFLSIRHNDGDDYIEDEVSFDDDGNSGLTRRHRSNSISSSDRGSGRGSCDSDGSSEDEEEERGDDVHRQRPGTMMMVRQAPKFTVGGGGGGGANDVRRHEEVRNRNIDGFTPLVL